MLSTQRMRRALAAPAVLAVLAWPGAAPAQNGSNYHVLSNGVDVAYIGVGAGGAQTALDGLGTHVAGEDLKGSHVTLLGDFGYRMFGWGENVCLFNAGPGGQTAIQSAGLIFIELDGLNGHAPPIFTNPACTAPSFPLGLSGLVPYGTGPGSSFSFLLANPPTGLGIPSSTVVLLPDNGLISSAAGGTATIVAAAPISIPVASTGFCWTVDFNWVPSALPLLDDLDGLWHYAVNSPDGNQYWSMSGNEQNLWQSQTVGLDAGATALNAFFANADYAMRLYSVEPNTIATLAPRPGGDFAATTANVSNELGAVVNPNGGFDAGRGSSAISFGGTAGVPNPVTGLGNQNPAAGAPITTLGFATWDNGGDGDGSVRLTWLSLDFLQVGGGNPDTDPGVTKAGGMLRLPVVSFGLLQALTGLGFGLFGHVTAAGFPGGIGGASWQLPVSPQPAACVGLAVNITYGTTGRNGSLGAPGGLTFNPLVADVSGSKQLFLFD
jgi:hypothetical protein